jgi:predicted TIM-barrel fold metal-dependent hydrolase
MANLVVSADSHVMEPATLWTERLDRKFQDRAPKVVQHEDGSYRFVAPGIHPFPVAAGFGIGKSGAELKEHLKKGYEAARPSGWDPAERLKDQDVDGVAAEVLYTTLGMPLFALDDAELQQACFSVFNNWLAEYASHAPRRLYPIALIPLEDIAAGVKELERCAKRGLRGAMIWGAPPEDRPYSKALYDPFWAAAQDLQMPISLHVITQRKQREIKFKFDGPQEEPADAKAVDAAARPKEDSSAAGPLPLADPIFEIQQSIRALIYGGALERFPNLKVVSAENDAGWIAHYLHRLDHFHEKLYGKQPGGKLKKMPGEYLREHLWATFQDDPVAPLTCSYFGEDHFMWASDFPHTDSTWPHSQEVIARDFAGVSDTVRRKIVSDNAVKLYRMDLN